MSKQTKPISNSVIMESKSPGVFSWLIAALSMTLLLLSLYAGHLIATGAYIAKLQNDFAAELNSGTSPLVLIDDERFLPLLLNKKNPAKRTSRVIALIQAKDYDKAKKILEHPSFPRTPLTQQLLDAVQELSSDYYARMADQPDAEVLELSRKALLSITKPRLDATMLSVYSAARKLAESYGFSLPELSADAKA